MGKAKDCSMRRVSYPLAVCLAYTAFLAGCGPRLSTPEELGQFTQAGPVFSEFDYKAAKTTDFHTGPYRVVPGDVLELEMPVILKVASSKLPDSLEKITPYVCRVSDAGTINLPIIGEMQVAGMRLAEIDEAVVNAYYPKYVVTPPTVVCSVREYEGEKARVFTVMGLVKQPGTFQYPPNVRYNLMEALAFARGFDPVTDPRYVKVYRKSPDGKVVSATFSIDDKSLADAYNVVIKPGDVIYVDHTLRTRINKFVTDVLYIGVGADVRYTGR